MTARPDRPTYDVPWCYDTTEIARRIAHGEFVSAAAFTPGGDLLCHVGLTLRDASDHGRELLDYVRSDLL